MGGSGGGGSSAGAGGGLGSTVGVLKFGYSEDSPGLKVYVTSTFRSSLLPVAPVYRFCLFVFCFFVCRFYANLFLTWLSLGLQGAWYCHGHHISVRCGRDVSAYCQQAAEGLSVLLYKTIVLLSMC